MNKRLLSVMFLALSCAVGLALAQGTTPTGIQKVGGIQLIRAEGKVALGPAPPVESITDLGSAGFTSIDYTQYTPPPMPMTTTIGPCTVATYTPPPSTPPSSPVSTPLDAGPVINLNGPNGMKQLPLTMGGSSAMLGGGMPLPPGLPPGILPGPTPLYLDPGTYTADNGAGGADVGPFSVTLNVPSPGFVWTNADSDLTIVRSAGVDIQWTGGDPTTTVLIQGGVTTVNPTTFQVTGGGGFYCLVPNNGEFMVTSDVLSLLPASGTGPSTAALSTLLVQDSISTNFTASGLDVGILLYSVGDSRAVVYQ